MNENSLKNLKPFKKGQSGNPKGRTPGSISLTRMLKEKLQEGDGKLAKELIEKMLARASEKSDPLVKEILERTDGKVPQAVEAKVDAELTINLVNYSDGDKDSS